MKKSVIITISVALIIVLAITTVLLVLYLPKKVSNGFEIDEIKNITYEYFKSEGSIIYQLSEIETKEVKEMLKGAKYKKQVPLCKCYSSFWLWLELNNGEKIGINEYVISANGTKTRIYLQTMELFKFMPDTFVE